MSLPGPFTPLPLFPHPFFSGMVDDAERHRPGLVAFIQDLRGRSAGIVKSNRLGWHSGDELLETDDEHVVWVVSSVTAYARRALAPFYRNWAASELVLGKLWANVLGPGGWHAPHHHAPSVWSGTYYVQVGTRDPTKKGGVSDTAGAIEFVNPHPGHAAWNQGGNFAVAPRPGLTVLFPSSLVHFVNANPNDEDRISIAYNFTVSSKAPG